MKAGDTVTLNAAFPAHRMPAGACGTVVSVHDDGSCQVKFPLMDAAPLVVGVPAELLALP